MSDGIYMAEDLKKELLERKKVLNTHGVGLAAPTSHHQKPSPNNKAYNEPHKPG